eukprot:Protomagalhaensia_sp_Gyna_25__1350@NODE_1679_length_1630_cov_840_619736_g1374_i0_p1_GENE_NODE_1679_length_1630_cov_840_619736_g1374_i0NODE_1679_length_1630_cov_840_619736_g1374_i0_p1_ORF_typecomplete_len448_score54_79Phage_Coat_A/PF05357_13/26Phage_Coat_A/PF05357_13/30Phage_Coat_A/PF05357_13/5_3e03_NODE_1679_length_1630_cov_840_619736_g1374_i02461589
MKLTKLIGAWWVVHVTEATNTLNAEFAIRPVDESRGDCAIAQCYGTDFQKCATAAARECAYYEMLKYTGILDGNDLCQLTPEIIVNEGKPNESTITLGLLNLDFSALSSLSTAWTSTGYMNLTLAEPVSAITRFSYKAWEEIGCTVNPPEAGSSVYLATFPADTQTAELRLNYISGATFPGMQVIPKPHTDISQTGNGFKSLEANALWYRSIIYNTTPHKPTVINMAPQVSGSCCSGSPQNMDEMARCTESGAAGCTLSGSITMTNSESRISNSCATSDLFMVPLNNLLPTSMNLQDISGSITLELNALPAANCVLTLYSVDSYTTDSDCGIADINDYEAFGTATLSTTARTVAIDSLPNGVRNVAVKYDRPSTECGGGIYSLGTTSLTAKVAYTKTVEEGTTTPAPTTTTTTVVPDPFPDNQSSGVQSLMVAAASTLAALSTALLI